MMINNQKETASEEEKTDSLTRRDEKQSYGFWNNISFYFFLTIRIFDFHCSMLLSRSV